MTRSKLARRDLRRPLVPLAALGVAGVVTAAVLTTGSASVAAGPGGSVTEAGAAASKGSVTIAGSGAAIGAPDVLRVSIEIGYREKSVSSALEKSNQGVRRVRDALHAEGVAARDIQTTSFSVHRSNSRKLGPGYRASQRLAVTLRDLNRAGAIIAEAADAGGNATSISGVSYAIEDRDELLRLAREAAFADAEAKAERYAGLAGRPLGKVRTIKESEGHYYSYYDEQLASYPNAAVARSASAGSGDVPLAAGSQTVSVRNTVVWELG